MTRLQSKARKHNHNIMRLRGVYSTIKTIRPKDRYDINRFIAATNAALKGVDIMLDEMGAEMETKRRARWKRELDEELDKKGIR